MHPRQPQDDDVARRGDEARPAFHSGWHAAFARALEAVTAGPGLVLVTGAPGTGKTLLLRELDRALRATGREVRLLIRGKVPGAVPGVATVPPADGAIMIDEADRLDPALLARLGHWGGTLLLAGVSLPTIDTLPAPRSVVRLGPLRSEEVEPFLMARLAQVRHPRALFSPDAIALLDERSGRVPRDLTRLAAAALARAETAGSGVVTAAHVGATVADRGPGTPELPAEADAAASAPPWRPAARAMPTASGAPPGAGARGDLAAALPRAALSVPPSGSPTRQWSGRRLAVASGAACAVALLAAVAWQRPGGGRGPARPGDTLSMVAAPGPIRGTASPPAAYQGDGDVMAGPVGQALGPFLADPAWGPEAAPALPETLADAVAQPAPPPTLRPPASAESASLPVPPPLAGAVPGTLPAAPVPTRPPLDSPPLIAGGRAGAAVPELVTPSVVASLPRLGMPGTLPPPPPAAAWQEDDAAGRPDTPPGQRPAPPADEPRPRPAGSRLAAAPGVERPRSPVAEPGPAGVASRAGDAPRRAALNQDATAAEARCQGIVLRSQIGEEPSAADLRFLRNGCRPG